MADQSPTRFLILLLALLQARFVQAQDVQSPLSETVSNTAVIEGIVTKFPSSEPLRGAEVYLAQGDNRKALYRVLTATDGKFSLHDIKPGKYKLWVSKTGFESPDRVCGSNQVQEGDELTLGPGDKISDMNLRLLSPAVITGAVFDTSGEPVTNAEVQATRFYSSRGNRMLRDMASARTDDRGQFRIFHVPPGRYYLRVSNDFELPVAKVTANAAKVEGYLPIYYPDTTDLELARVFDLRAGQELAGINFTVHSTKVLRIRGRVVNGLSGEPMDASSLAVTPLQIAFRENKTGSTFAEESGYFEISNLFPGRYWISADTWDSADRRRWGGGVEVELSDSSLNDVRIKEFPGHDVRGRIEIADGKKLDLPRVQVTLSSRRGFNSGEAFTNLKPDGSFVFRDLQPDSYDVFVAGLPESFFLKSARLGNNDVTETGLNVENEDISNPLVLRVASPSAQVDGTVSSTDGKLACAASLVLLPRRNRRAKEWFQHYAEIDPSGHFTLGGIAPGDYLLFAWDNIENVAYLDPAALKPYENVGFPLHLDEGDHHTVNVKVIHVSSDTY